MEFPHNCLTNVYQLDGISQIDWTLYEIDGSSDFIANEFLELNDNGNDDLETKTDRLARAAATLRAKGIHSIYDPTDIAIWTFEIKGGDVSNDDEKSRHADISQLLGSCNLSAKSSGTILPTDLPKVTKHYSATAQSSDVLKRSSKTPHNPNVQAYEANAQVKSEHFLPGRVVDARQHHYDDAAIIVRLNASISMSLLRPLCTDARWLSIGMCSCIGPYRNQDDALGGLELCPSTSEVSILSIEVRWRSCGSLIITRLVSPAEGLRRLSANAGSDELVGAPVGSEVLLVPSGMTATFISHVADQYHDAKRSIIARLKHHNIPVAPATEWVKLRVLAEGMSDLPVIFIWPAELCLLKSSGLEQHEEDADLRSFDEVFHWIDPLEAAERWFLDKPSRDRALKAKSKVQAEQAASGADVLESSDEEELLQEEGMLNGRLTLPDVSGVYPTPPDGHPSFPPHSGTGTREQSNQQGPGVMSSTAEVNLCGSSAGASRTAEVTPQYDDDEHGDLFGDADSEMFAENDLTEDDFNFFDEQSVNALDLKDPQDTVLSPSLAVEEDNLQPSTEQINPSESKETASITNSAAFPISETPVVGESEEAQDLTEKDQATGLNKPPFKPCQPDTGTIKATDIKSKGVPLLDESSVMHKPTKLQNNDFDTAGSSLQGSHGGLKFDHKYLDDGRFCFTNVETPEGEKPGKLSEPEKLAIPDFKHSCDRVSEVDESEGTSTDRGVAYESDQERSLAAKNTPEESGMPLYTTLKRKREQSSASDKPLTPQSSHENVRSPNYEVQDPYDMPGLALLIPSLPKPYPSIIKMLGSGKVQLCHPHVLKDQGTYLRVAQILADQIGPQDAAKIGYHSELFAQARHISYATESYSEIFEGALQQILPGVKQLDLKRFASIGEESKIPATNSTSQHNGKPSQSASSLDEVDQPFMINAPMVRVQRMQAHIDISTSALQFWEELGLAPASSEKNVMAFCICPESHFVEERAICFLESVSSAYQSCKLGVHHLGFGSIGHHGALVSVPRSTDGAEAPMERIFEACERLGRKLVTSKAQSTNFVIYMVNASTNPTSLPALCEAFLKLSDTYALALEEQKMETTNDISLHILPLAEIASNEHLVIPGPGAYKKVAFQVYSRCAPLQDLGDVSPFSCAPAIQLARTIPRAINLQLTSTPVAGLPHLDRCIHVGYCWHPHANWLSVSWTDNQGSLQWSACYCVATTESRTWPTLQGASKEIWDTTMDLINTVSVPWRIYIAKIGRMSRQELDVWLALAMETVHSAFVTLLAVDERSSLQLSPYVGTTPNPLIPTPATPVSTPAANNVSPDQTGYASTPGAAPAATSLQNPGATSYDHDNDARLVDITEEAWGVVTGPPSIDPDVIVPGSTPTLCPALLSGYLIKRAGARDEDGLLSLAVDIVHASKPSPALMKDVLVIYRSLGTLARSRGVIHSVRGVLPWHLAIAKKSYASVEALMPWTGDT